MADAVAVNVIANTTSRYVVHLANVSDGTGETGVVKIDKSTLLSPAGIEPVSIDIEVVRWNVQGFTSVKLYWDHTTDDLAMALAGSGMDDFLSSGPCPEGVPNGLKDPRSAGGTGDLILTTAGTTSGNTYDITLWCRKTAI